MKRLALAAVTMFGLALFGTVSASAEGPVRTVCSHSDGEVYAAVHVDEDLNATLSVETWILEDREPRSILDDGQEGRAATFSVTLPVNGVDLRCDNLRVYGWDGMIFLAWHAGSAGTQITVAQTLLIVAQIHERGLSVWDELPIFEQYGDQTAVWEYDIEGIDGGLQLNVFEEGCRTCGTYYRYYPGYQGNSLREIGAL